MTATVLEKTRSLLEMIKFSHTVFAFPFALMGAVLASMANGAPPNAIQIFWICLAMVGARSAAMGLNRFIDAGIDAENPRTAGRHIPAGIVSRGEAILFIAASVALLFGRRLDAQPPLFLSGAGRPCLFVLYAYCKRFTSLAHIVLGLCLAGAPVGAWIALRGDIAWPILVLGLAVLVWVAGFDIFYALQDLDFDRRHGLHSIPVRLGEKNAIFLAELLHGAMIGLLLLLPLGLPLGWLYYAGIAVVSALIVWNISWSNRAICVNSMPPSST